MIKVLITGGKGDIAQSIVQQLEKFNKYEIYAPGKDELNVRDITSVEQYIDKIKPDILINNAGYVKVSSIYSTSCEIERSAIEINLLGTFYCTNAVLKKNRNAKIINIGSAAGIKVHSDWSSYCASKAGVIMATKCWAAEGVDVVCISPGRTKSKMRKSLFPNEDESTLLNPDDFAKIVIYAIENKYEKGRNVEVNINNISTLIREGGQQ